MLVEFQSGSVLHGALYIEHRAVKRITPVGDNKTAVIVGNETITVMGMVSDVHRRLEDARASELYELIDRLTTAIERGTQYLQGQR